MSTLLVALGGFVFALLLIAIVVTLGSNNKVGRTIYLDKGKHSKTFKSEKHRLVAKPDRIVSGSEGEVIPNEFKSRKGRVSKRDVTQISIATIAVRDSGYIVNQAKIEYGNGHIHTEPMASTEEMMNGRIGYLVRLVRGIKKGEVPQATPAAYKCGYCPYRESCIFAASKVSH